MAVAMLDEGGWLDQVLEDFERFTVRRRRAGSIRIFRWALGDLFDFMKGRGMTHIQQLDRPTLEAWQDVLAARISPGSQQSAATAARALINWAADWDLVDLKLLRGLAKVHVPPDDDPEPIPDDDLDRLLAYLLPRWPHMGIVALRDRAIIIYILTTTARVSEALQARRDDFARPLVVQKGGSKQELWPGDTAVEMVRDYLAVRIDDSPWLWISHKTNAPLSRLRPAGVWEICQKLAKKVGIAPFSTHQLRTTALTAMDEAEVPPMAAMKQAGHHGLGTMHKYVRVRKKTRIQAVEAIEARIQLARGPAPIALPKFPRYTRPRFPLS
jgi:integrase